AAQIAAWAQVLASLGEGDKISRLVWVERADPEHLAPEHLAPGHLGQEAAPNGAVSACQRALRADYRQLVAHVGTLGTRREVHLGLQVATKGADQEAVCAEASAKCRAVAGALAGAGIASRPLGLFELAGLVRTWADPSARARARAWDGLDPGGAGPLAREVSWDHLRSDGALHRAYVVAAWPRVPLGPSWLEPLLACAPPRAARTLAIHLEPVPADLARRQAQAARLNAGLDQAQRSRWGFVSGPRQEAELAEAARLEEELVAGYPSHRLGAVLMVSAPDEDALGEASSALEQAATSARVDLRCAYGSQDLAWASTLPICRARLRGRA
ncbi:MAG: SCO6880 family protein, partial [Acidimicrobiales bacterium]